jgi:glycosyltransferase involved in cell wall biosynthesis
MSGRRMGHDLASSTEIFLCEYLKKNGNQVTLASPGILEDPVFTHRELSDIKFPGLTSISGARNAGKLLNEPFVNKFDRILIDWRFVYTLSSRLGLLPIPWQIIDRGPPVRSNLLYRMQKLYWKAAWRIANNHASGGFTVSKQHSEFVKQNTKFNGKLHEVNAGAKKNEFLGEKSNPRELLKLAYVGQLDKSRDVMKILDLSINIESRGIKHQIHICGKGDQEKAFMDLPESSRIIFHGKRTHRETMRILSECHVGIMPMPDTPIWRISSPIKLAEYLASGLLILGNKHPGNMVNCNRESFILESNGWERSCIPRLMEKLDGDWDGVTRSSLMLGEKLSWQNISNRLEVNLQ